MKWLLLVTLICWGLSYFSKRTGNSPDEAIASSWAQLFFGGIGAVLTMVYLLLAFWLHRFL